MEMKKAQWTNRAIFDEQGQVVKFQAVGSDITERVRAEQSLRRYADEQAALYAVASAAAASLEPDELLSTVLDVVLPVLDSDAGWVTLPGPTLDDPPRIAAWRNVPDEFLAAETTLSLRDCPVCAPLLSGAEQRTEPILCTECSRLPSEALDGANLHSHVGIPLSASGRVLGILNVGWHAPRPYTEADRTLLTAIGQQVGIALQNAQLYQTARQVDRLRVLNELDRSLAATLDPDTVVEITLQQTAAAVDAPMGALFALPPQAGAYPERIFTLSRGWAEVATFVENGQHLQALSHRVRRGRGPIPLSGDGLATLIGGEYPGLTKRWGPHSLLIPVWSDETLTAMLALGGRPAARPFTGEDRALAQAAANRAGQAIQNARQHQAAREAEARYRDLYHGVSVGLYRTTPEGKILSANRALAQMLGYPDLETLLAVNATDLYLDAGDRQRWQTLVKREGEVCDFEARLRHYDGSASWVQDNARAVRDANGRVVHYEGSLIDVTERKRAEDELRRSEASLAEAQRIAHLGNWEWDIGANKLWRSDEACRVLGLPPREFGMPRDVSLESVHPDDREFVERSIDQALYEGQPYSIDHRLLLPDGSVCVVHEQAEVTFDESGQPIRMVGTVQDVTERAQAEKALRESEELFRKTFTSQGDAIFIHSHSADLPSAILDCNPAATEVFGYSRQEMLGQPTSFLHVDEADFEVFAERVVSAAEKEGFLHQVEFRLKRKDGTVFPTEISVRPLKDEQGRHTGWVGVVRDITERVRSEKQLNAIYQLGRELTLLRYEGAIVQQALEAAADVLQFKSLGCGLVDEAAGELVYQYRITSGVLETSGEGLPAGCLRLPLDGERGISAAVARSGQALNVPDTSQDPRYLLFPGHRLGGSELCVPVKVGGRVIGVLNAEYVEPYHFTPADQRLLQALADQTAVALENARLHRASQEQVVRLAVLNAIGAAVTASLDMDTVVSQVLGLTCQALDATTGSILLLEPATGELVFAQTMADEADILSGYRLAPGEGIAGWVAQHGRPVCVNDARQDPRYCDGVSRFSGLETHSLLCAPLRYREELIGVIEIINKRKGEFSDGDLGLLEAVAPTAAVALENARLYTETRRRARELAVLNRASEAMASTLNLSAVLEQVMAEVRTLFEAEGASALLYEPESDELLFAAAASPASKELIGIRFPVTAGVAGWALRERVPVLVEDARQDARFYGCIDDVTGLTTRSLLAVPLIYQEQAIGVIEVMNKAAGAFDQRDLEMLESVASSASIAITNARLYQNLQAQLKALQEAQAQLVRSEKMSALGRLVASIAHEINNPLQSIQTFVTLALEDLKDPRRQESIERYLGIVESEIERIATIVQRMRDFYRPARAGRHPTDLHAVLESVLALAGKRLQHGNVTVEREWAGELPAVQANPDHLKQVFLNLTLNAIDAMPAGGTLRVRTTLDQKQDPDAVRIEFSDTGEGMAPEALSRLFEPFFTTKEHGSGLGLSISYGIIEAHNGQIVVASEEGEGTTFTILLPAVGAEPFSSSQARKE